MSSQETGPAWEEKAQELAAVLEQIQDSLISGTVLDRNAAAKLQEQQLSLKLKAQVAVSTNHTILRLSLVLSFSSLQLLTNALILL
eukprot:SAG31_NODE_16_length_36206_cov_27.355728_20_plen_86_part_00